MANKSEQVQLMISEVRNKKKDGTLYMMGERIAWCPNGKDKFDISVMYADVKCQKVSPEGKAKVQLQIILISDESYVFQFINPQTARSTRDDVKNLLAKMLPLFRRKIDNELKEKNKLLHNDRELFAVYKDLVVTGVISPDEFWASHSAKLSKISKEGNPDSNLQRVGVSPGFLADVKQMDGCNDLLYNLSSDTIQSILRTFPAVKKKYLDKVPNHMNNQEFWSMFFQSHYFHRDRVNHGNNSKDLFADCVKMDEKEINAILKVGVTDPFNDLTYLADEDSTSAEGYGLTIDSSSLPKMKPSNNALIQKNIIKRFNYQSAMILKHDKREASEGEKTADAPVDEPPAPKKLKLQESIRYLDLEESSAKNSANFTLHRSERYCHGPTTAQVTRQQFNPEYAHRSLAIVSEQCQLYQSKLASVLSSSDAASALNTLTTNTNILPSGGVDGVDDALSRVLNPAQCAEMKQLYLSSAELLRHFWLCFPANTPALQEKIQRLFASIQTFHQSRVIPYKEQLQRHRVGTIVTDHLEEMLWKASEKFNAWQNRRMNRR